ncbi:MAG: BatD family protein [Salinivirgaceae bacterium]
MIRYCILALHILLFAYTGTAQDISLSGEAPGVVKVGERFRLVYKADAKVSAPHIELPDEFTVLSGPGISQSTSMQWINGKQSTSFNLSFTYIVVIGKEGKYTIPPATISKNGTSAKSNPITIEALGGNSNAQAQQKKQPQQAQTKTQSGGKDFFVRVHLNRNNIYRGEHVVATLKLYTKLNLAGFEDIKFPAFNGFFNQEIETPSQISLQRENVNGEIYQTGIIKKYLLFPQRSGDITIEPFEIEAVIRERVRSADPFDDFFGGRYKKYKVSDKSPEKTLTVKPLPIGKPATFYGAVGNYKLETSIDKTKLKANESLSLKVKIIGEGNLRLIQTPTIEFPGDFEVYDPKVNQSIRTGESGATGFITYEYLLIPRHAGTFKLDPIQFTFFNPATGKYKTLTGQSFSIEVEKGDADESGAVVSNVNRQDITNIGSDIRYIKTSDIRLVQKGQYFYGSSAFWLIYILGIGSIIILIIIRRKKLKENANQMLMRTKKANKVSRKRLKEANKMLKADNDSGMYEAILKAIWGYLADKLTIDAASLTRDSVGEVLSENKVDSEIIDDLIKLLDECEFARYAPSAAQADSRTVYNNASEIINKLEKTLK